MNLKTSIVVLSLLLLLGCTLATEALRAVGIPLGAGVMDAATHVDSALWSWVSYALGVGTLEVPRAAVKVKRHLATKRTKEAQSRAPTHVD